MSNRWRTVDIIVAAVIAVAFGAVFYAWNSLWDGPAHAIPLPGRAIIYGVWLLPAVLGPMVIRKPGAALFTELVAAIVSTFFGSPWGLSTILYGCVQGVAGELPFAFTGYRVFKLPTALVSGALAGAAAGLLDLVLYYGSWGNGTKAVYVLLVALSSAIIAGAGSWALQRALAQTGVLNAFASGRDRAAV